MEVLQSGAGGGTDDHRVEDGIDIRCDDFALLAFPQPVEILGRHLHEERNGAARASDEPLRNIVFEGDSPPAQHLLHEGLDVTIGERRQGNVLEVVDEIHQSEGVERAGQIDRAADQPTDRIPCRCRIQSLGTKPGEELTQQRFIIPRSG